LRSSGQSLSQATPELQLHGAVSGREADALFLFFCASAPDEQFSMQTEYRLPQQSTSKKLACLKACGLPGTSESRLISVVLPRLGL
jgi:hypothetical protein